MPASVSLTLRTRMTPESHSHVESREVDITEEWLQSLGRTGVRNGVGLGTGYGAVIRWK